jgi:iron complex outermembrane receptor protein
MFMKKALYLSMVCSTLLLASDITMDAIDIEATVLEDVSGEEVKSADLAEALSQKIPNITLVRRSGIANDIILRGQKKDNINVIIDGGKVCGACPNRMDPPTSHIVTSNISSIKIVEGPFDVENFGTLSGGVYITTKKPTQEISGDVTFNAGSWNYKKAAATISGGTENFRVMLGASTESSDQYEDGDGNTFADQMDNYIKDHPSLAGTAFQPKYRDLEAYDKKSFIGKVYIDITDDQQFKFGYTANRSDDVLYPTSKMDALYDDSDLYNAEYKITNLGDYSKELSILGYYSEVAHPMSTLYRKSALANPAVGAVTSYLESSIGGLRIKNIADITDDLEFRIGLDTSRRNWDGEYQSETGKGPQGKPNIEDVDTNNIGVFAELEKYYDDVTVTLGMRYDDTSIDTAGPEQDNDYSAFSANLYATYDQSSSLSFFGGLGQSSRVPDGKELYFKSSMGGLVGTPTLDQTTNQEIDLGMENRFELVTIRTKLFYSMLKDYIAYNSSKMKNRYENVDATIYGFDITGTLDVSDTFYLDFGMAYQRGKKDDPLENQTGTDLAEIPPFKYNASLNYEYASKSTAMLEVFGASSWDNIDAENGEQELDAYLITNVKVDHDFGKGFSVAVGINNILDKTYAITNTYNDMILITDGTTKEVMLMNEPGRYFYINATYKF